MAKQLQLRRGTTAQHSTFTGAAGEVTVDTDKDVVVVHDGATAGGFPSQKELVSGNNIKTINGSSILTSGNLDLVTKVSSIAGLASLDGTTPTVIVTDLDRGGTFIWSSTGTANDGTVFAGSSGYWVRQYSGAVNVKWFGATNNSVDVNITTNAFKAAFASGLDILIPSEVFYINDTINITSFMTINAYGATIVWSGSSIPLFKITAPAESINIKGGLYTGTPSDWLYALGVSENPSRLSDYARFNVSEVHVSGATTFINAQKAARFRVESVETYTANAFNLYGKIVETKISDSVIFGSSGAVGTYGIKSQLYSGANLWSYPEGIHISNCTIDNFGRTFEIYDIYVLTVTNCYIGKVLNDKVPIYILKGSSTHCREITFNGNTIAGGIEFGDSSVGNAYNAVISNNNFHGTNGSSIYLDSNSYQVKIDGNSFNDVATAGNSFAVFARDNVHYIDVTNNSVDSTYTRVFQSSGATGSNINICNNYSSIATPTWLSRPINQRNTGIANDTRYVQLGGAVTAGNSFTGTISTTFTKGEKFLLIINVGLYTTASGYLSITLPSGLTAANGSGWSDSYWYIGANPSYTKHSRVIPLYASADGSGTILLNNYDIAYAVEVYYHSDMSLVRI